jgi:hypothetical protein
MTIASSKKGVYPIIYPCLAPHGHGTRRRSYYIDEKKSTLNLRIDISSSMPELNTTSGSKLTLAPISLLRI